LNVFGKKPRRPVVGAAAIVLRGPRILLAQRRAGKMQGWWNAPGGHIEWRESALDAARRELREEAGMTALNARILRWAEDVSEEEDHHYIVALVLCDVADREDPRLVEPEKSSAWDWYDIDSLPQPVLRPLADLVPTLREIVEARRPLA
jgi:8-oxo-dGTP diphosphatase